MKTVLVVCTGNLCRSPMATALLRKRLADLGLAGEVQVESAGIRAQPGQPAVPIARSLVAERGLTLEDHLSRPMTEQLLARADLVIAMEESQRSFMFHLSMKHLHKVFLLSELSGGYDDVDDPLMGTREEYVRTMAHIDKLLEEGMPRILKELRVSANTSEA